MDSLVAHEVDPVTRIAPQIGCMAVWTLTKFEELMSARTPRDCTGVFVYAAMLNKKALVARSLVGGRLEIELQDDDGRDGFWWSDFYDSARRHRTLLGVFDAEGELLIEHQIAPRGWEMSAGEAIDELKVKLREIGVPEKDL